MSKKLKKKPLRKYPDGGESNPFAMFQGSGLDNPFASGINYNLFGQLQTTPINQQFQNFSADNFGQQIGQAATSTAASLGQIPGFRDLTTPLTESRETAGKLQDQIINEKGLVRVGGKWKNSQGEEYTSKELNELVDMNFKDINYDLTSIFDRQNMNNELF